jgi:regulator of replication initiation timing
MTIDQHNQIQELQQKYREVSAICTKLMNENMKLTSDNEFLNRQLLQEKAKSSNQSNIVNFRQGSLVPESLKSLKQVATVFQIWAKYRESNLSPFSHAIRLVSSYITVIDLSKQPKTPDSQVYYHAEIADFLLDMVDFCNCVFRGSISFDFASVVMATDSSCSAPKISTHAQLVVTFLENVTDYLNSVPNMDESSIFFNLCVMYDHISQLGQRDYDESIMIHSMTSKMQLT